MDKAIFICITSSYQDFEKKILEGKSPTFINRHAFV